MIFSQDFKLQLIVPQTTYILKEPILVKGIVENTSDKTVTIAYGEKGFKAGISMKRADGKQRNDCMKPEYVDYMGYTSFEAVPGWKKEINEDVSYGCKDDPGEFIVQFGVSSQGPYINYSSEPEEPRRMEKEIDAWKGALSSEPVRITIEQPQGEDKKAYEYFKGEPLSKPTEILQNFPTSTYAGYVLVKRIPDYSNPLFKSVPPQEQVRIAREEGQTVTTFPDKRFEEYFQQLDKYVKGGNVPDQLRTLIYGFYGDLLVQRGRFSESAQAFKCALDRDCPSASGGKEKFFHDRAKAFLEVLIESNKVETDPKKAETESVR